MPTPVIDLDELTVAQCCDGLIDYRKLTMPERDEVYERMTARGYAIRQIATRCHGSFHLVQDAATRVRARDAAEGAADAVVA